MSTDPKPAPAGTIPEDDLDDVIGGAEALKKAEEGKLTLDEVKAVGRELDLADEHVEKAVRELELHRQQERAQALRAAARQKRALTIGAAVVAALVALVGVMSLSARSTLVTSYAEVSAKRAQVHSVVERQAKVEATFAGRAPSPDRDAELLGAENRVRIERKRYDEAAAKYNADAQGLGAGLATSLFGLPKTVPMSNEVTAW